ncbi:melanoma antigen family D, 4, isoform CRA_c [Homo sapiens]|uniref:Isoform 3 of Melanoma-associated antigen D4 n=1 Tax=Homo sapiens TaxID=9606 RepID=Q96JG8-3|nr:melanoma antigen family D, 4, isoform CRA_c [Homo sapiens]EAW62891.1 melanoma antigen family D, 4, isoform CRA_c [Homo sapiens]EAW62892.1 melanoma antigen family D, 4, isoform CRA_c [Homo sapiens]EAW62893.1 melanoma antigen family D, 4, isoform CRA_c [Homo sapiens]BAB33380.1 MAGE-E1c [Homo sapiens]
MAEGSFSVQSESYSVEDMDEGSDEVGEEEMVEGNDYEEFGAFGGYGTLTSFDIHILRAFGSLGPGLRILSNEPWELENPVLAQTLVEALQLDPETLANETAARAANVARAAASNRAARAAAAAARTAFSQVVASHRVATPQVSGEDTQPTTYAAEAQGPTPEPPLASPQTSQMLVTSKMAAPEAPATSAQSQTGSPAQEAATEGPSSACAFSQAPCAREVDANRPSTAFLGQNDVFDFTQPAGVSGMAFPRPKRPAPAQEAATEGPSAASGVPQTGPGREVAATRPKTTKSGKALAKTRWVEPQNVVAAAAAKAKMATSIPEPEGAAAATAQHSAEPWARMGGKRTKKVRSPCPLPPPHPLAPVLSFSSLSCSSPPSPLPLLPLFSSFPSFSPHLPSPPLLSSQLVHVSPTQVC